MFDGKMKEELLLLQSLSVLVSECSGSDAKPKNSLESLLVSLVDLARSGDGRHKLAVAGAIPSLLPYVPELLLSCTPLASSPQSGCQIIHEGLRDFVLFLKLLRNLCAGNSVNQDAFLSCEGLAILAPVAESLAESCCVYRDGSAVAEGFAAISLDSKPDDTPVSSSEVKIGTRHDPVVLESIERSESDSQRIPRERELDARMIEALQMLLQLLGNVAGRGEVSQSAIWEVFFPAIFESFASISSEKVQGPLCMIIYTCCRESENRCLEFSRKSLVVSVLLTGADIIAEVSWLQNLEELFPECTSAFTSVAVVAIHEDKGGASATAPNDWLERLISHLCLTRPFFPILFTQLANLSANTPETMYLSQNTFTLEQASLLDILNALLSAQEGKNMGEPSHNDQKLSSQTEIISETSAAFLVDIIRYAAKCAASVSLSVLTLPTNSPLADILGLSLSITRIVCALDERNSTATAKLVSSGLISLMLDMLRSLGPPKNAKLGTSSKPNFQQEVVDIDSATVNSEVLETSLNVTNVTSASDDDSVASTEPFGTGMAIGGNSKSKREDEQALMLSQDIEIFPRKNVYIGYRRDLIAVIANASHKNFSIQEEVRMKGGLLLVLEQCMPDSQNPFLREWGLWAIRNLLEGNTKNQSELADLEVRSAVDDPRLKDVGISVEINPETGRPRLVNATASFTRDAGVDEFM